MLYRISWYMYNQWKSDDQIRTERQIQNKKMFYRCIYRDLAAIIFYIDIERKSKFICNEMVPQYLIPQYLE